MTSAVVRRSRRSTAIFALVLVVYGSVAGGRYLFDRDEVFPAAAFALYSHANPTNTDYAVRIVAIDGVALDPPRYFQDAPDLFRAARDVTAQSLMDRVGHALDEGDRARADELREVLESLYLDLDRHGRVEYEVVERRFVALERWRTGEFRRETPLAAYTATFPDGDT